LVNNCFIIEIKTNKINSKTISIESVYVNFNKFCNNQDTFGTQTDGSLHIQLSREELAGMIGTATESCIRLLSEFNKNGWITLDGKKIKIAQKNALKKISS